MHRTRVKFDGIMRPEDAIAAANLGADAIGMVLHANTPRLIDLATARQILAVVPPFVTPLGIFVDASAEIVLNITSNLQLRCVQLHGNESAETIAALENLIVIKAIRVSREHFGDGLRTWRAAIEKHKLKNLKALLLETAGTKEAGGTGTVNDWETIRAHQAAGDFQGLPPIIAAGGLRPEIVGDVVRTLRPWAVDVSSGIESAIGIKSKEKMAMFIEAVAAADKQ